MVSGHPMPESEHSEAPRFSTPAAVGF